jgi:TatD DNase family protein
MSNSVKIKYFDAHCHLQDQRIIDSVENIILQAQKSSICNVVCNGTSPGDWESVKQIANKYTIVLPAYGVHPWYLKISDDWKDILIEYLNSHKYSSIGECGLDKNVVSKFSYEHQTSVLSEHFDIAHQLNKPVSVHCVKAYQLLFDILKKEDLDVPVVIHSFSGSKEMMRQFCKLNVFFSFSGTITRKNSKCIDVLRDVPREQLLLETDSPDLLPSIDLLNAAGIDDNINVPSNIVVIAKFAADVLKIGVDELNALIGKNFGKVFREQRGTR